MNDPSPVLPRPIRGVLFDMDGVVIDSERLFCRFWQEAAVSFGYPMTFQQALTMRSTSAEVRQPMLEGYFGAGVDQAAIREKRNELMAAYLGNQVPEAKPGIYELLDYLDTHGIPAAITSSAAQERIREQLTPLNLYHRFRKICSSQDVPHGKPAPDIYIYGAQQLGLKPEECLAVEDTPPGIYSAYQAGCLPIIVPDLDQPSGEVLKRVYAKADTLVDIIPILENLSSML